MDIILMPVGSTTKFVFPALPETIEQKSAAKHQTFDILSLGTYKTPMGTDVDEISWKGVFFGPSKKKEAVVKSNVYKEPSECINVLDRYMKNGTTLNLIVTETWINMDVTIASFHKSPVGAYGNVEYSISFVQDKDLRIYDTSEMNISAYKKKVKSRSNASKKTSGDYEVKKGDTLMKIARRKCGSSSKWSKIYDLNKEIIEKTAKKYREDSDHGHWIYPGTVLELPA